MLQSLQAEADGVELRRHIGRQLVKPNHHCHDQRGRNERILQGRYALFVPRQLPRNIADCRSHTRINIEHIIVSNVGSSAAAQCTQHTYTSI